MDPLGHYNLVQEPAGNNLCGISVAELGNLLSENKTIKRLSLEWNCITADINSFQTFSSGLGVNSGLEYLDLRNNQLSHVAVSFLVKALETNSSLKYLDLRWNNIGAVGGNCILEALNTNRSLLKIELQGTHVPKETCNLIESSLQSNMEKVHLGPDLGLIKEKTGRERIKEKELSTEMLRSKGAPEIEDDLNGNTRFRTTDLANHKIERDHRTINGEHRTSCRTSDREERTSSRTSDRGNEHRIPNNEIRITNREQRRTERWCRRRKVGYRKDERETRSMDREAKHDYDSNRISRSMEFECEEELRPSIQAELKEEREKVRKLELQENARDRESLLRDEWRDQVSRMRDEWREDEERIREDWIREENKIKRICEERGLQIAQVREKEAMVSTLRATARDLEENCIDWRTRYDELEQKYEYIQVNWEKNCQESTGTSSAETTPIQDEKKKLQKEKESLRKEKDMLLVG
ncbi:leucine-rich repeat-containing protein 45 [Eurytemora carolleeae]|uniref:leucine-rich repeat-containing protein 45 n=1 Tax=Eurytemora carolleeae TaxID=1294199 RepID=UPI000C7870DF|nr:leucine-rich repeat-containing protein 45 [Eurytemora carolleeae]|eukprot:XP_023328381.1 leucine-rich repeat-containing protein 45-like [Eurytemora affinis]